MIFQPRNVQPSSVAIDGTKENIFSLTAQTDTSIIAHQLTIYSFDNNLVYDNSKISLTNYAYNGDNISIPIPADSFENGNNYKWSLRLYQSEKDILITYGFVQESGTELNFKIQQNINIKPGMTIIVNGISSNIVDYNVNTGDVTVDIPIVLMPNVGDNYYIYSDFIDTTSEYIFYAREESSVVISNSPTLLTLKYHNFNGVYSQVDGISIKYHTFNLYSLGSIGEKILIDTTGKVYSANLQYYYDGFRTGQKYFIELIVENNMDIIINSPTYEFDVLYDVIEYLQQPVADFILDKNANRISWVAPVEMEGFVYSSADSEIKEPNILYQTPYDKVNSLYTNGVYANWYKEEGLYEIPDNAQISIQFSPDDNFYYGNDGFYDGFQVLVEGSPEDKYTKGYFNVYINEDLFGVLSPDFENDGTLRTNVVADNLIGENDKYSFAVENSIDISSIKYITFKSTGLVSEIIDYDEVNKIVTVRNELISVPNIGDELFYNIYKEAHIYTGIKKVFVLSQYSFPQANEGYYWDDNSTWNDNLTWVEGGTPLEIVCNSWWKSSVNQQGVIIEKIII